MNLVRVGSLDEVRRECHQILDASGVPDVDELTGLWLAPLMNRAVTNVERKRQWRLRTAA